MPEPAVVEPAVVSVDAVAERIVALIAEQTGYPAEMLAIDLDLEADLGIDTVKQAELFATDPRANTAIERDDNLKLRDYPTLNHVVGFVRDRTPQPVTTQRPGRPPPDHRPSCPTTVAAPAVSVRSLPVEVGRAC